MPVKSYILQPVKGTESQLIDAIGRLSGCELIPTERPDIYVLVTDTPRQDAEDELQMTLETMPGIGCLSLVSAYDDHDGV